MGSVRGSPNLENDQLIRNYFLWAKLPGPPFYLRELCCVTMHDAPSPLEFYPPSMTSYLNLPFFSTFPTSVMLLRGRSIFLVGRCELVDSGCSESGFSSRAVRTLTFSPPLVSCHRGLWRIDFSPLKRAREGGGRSSLWGGAGWVPSSHRTQAHKSEFSALFH